MSGVNNGKLNDRIIEMVNDMVLSKRLSSNEAASILVENAIGLLECDDFKPLGALLALNSLRSAEDHIKNCMKIWASSSKEDSLDRRIDRIKEIEEYLSRTEEQDQLPSTVDLKRELSSLYHSTGNHEKAVLIGRSAFF